MYIYVLKPFSADMLIAKLIGQLENGGVSGRTSTPTGPGKGQIMERPSPLLLEGKSLSNLTFLILSKSKTVVLPNHALNKIF